MYIGGVSLNLMSLGGLALGIGMLVDNAIVVLENIHVQRERGLPSDEAAVKGTAKVAAAVVASTLTTVCVFCHRVRRGCGGPAVRRSRARGRLLAHRVAVCRPVLRPDAGGGAPAPSGSRPSFREMSRSAQLNSIPQLREGWTSAAVWAEPYLLDGFVVRFVCKPIAIVVLGLATASAVASTRSAGRGPAASEPARSRRSGPLPGPLLHPRDLPLRPHDPAGPWPGQEKVLGIVALAIAVATPISSPSGNR